MIIAIFEKVNFQKERYPLNPTCLLNLNLLSASKKNKSNFFLFKFTCSYIFQSSNFKKKLRFQKVFNLENYSSSFFSIDYFENLHRLNFIHSFIQKWKINFHFSLKNLLMTNFKRSRYFPLLKYLLKENLKEKKAKLSTCRILMDKMKISKGEIDIDNVFEPMFQDRENPYKFFFCHERVKLLENDASNEKIPKNEYCREKNFECWSIFWQKNLLIENYKFSVSKKSFKIKDGKKLITIGFDGVDGVGEEYWNILFFSFINENIPKKKRFFCTFFFLAISSKIQHKNKNFLVIFSNRLHFAFITFFTFESLKRRKRHQHGF